MRNMFIVTAAMLALAGCGKIGITQSLTSSVVNNWVEYRLPKGCTAKQISAGPGGLRVLCEDGRVFG